MIASSITIVVPQLDFVQVIGSAQIHLHPLQAGRASRVFGCIFDLRIGSIRDIVEWDRCADGSFSC
ncbi:hypothetical protein SDC9_198638 [bioreactor metagenome]|uniref:Uncharacterized protein n=1 Tax=bioreactor metagenome TaxID=1076179 RepID=A0A645II71_9ZZZZ